MIRNSTLEGRVHAVRAGVVGGDPLERELHVLARQLAVAAVEHDALLQLEVPAQAVRRALPRLGEHSRSNVPAFQLTRFSKMLSATEPSVWPGWMAGSRFEMSSSTILPTLSFLRATEPPQAWAGVVTAGEGRRNRAEDGTDPGTASSFDRLRPQEGQAAQCSRTAEPPQARTAAAPGSAGCGRRRSSGESPTKSSWRRVSGARLRRAKRVDSRPRRSRRR